VDYLEGIVAGHNWIIHPSAVMLRSRALEQVGGFDTPHSKHSIDFNLFLRLAAKYGPVFVPKELCKVRIHPGQESQIRFHAQGGTGPVANAAERTDAIAYLLDSPRAKDGKYRRWLAERLLQISMSRSALTAELLPDLNLGWTERSAIAAHEIAALIPSGERFILVDEAAFSSEDFAGQQPVPFVEHDGQYWGPPADDAMAIDELEKWRRSGVHVLVIAWPAFWWLDYYAGLRDYLYSNFRCVRNNSCLIVFDMERRGGGWRDAPSAPSTGYNA
jgi:hypothetical protein